MAAEGKAALPSAQGANGSNSFNASSRSPSYSLAGTIPNPLPAMKAMNIRFAARFQATAWAMTRACGLCRPLGSQITWTGLWPSPWAPRPRLRRVRTEDRDLVLPKVQAVAERATRATREKCAAKSLWVSIEGARAPSPVGSALTGNGPVREKFPVALGLACPLLVALRQESGQLAFDPPALAFREETTRQFRAQFVDTIDVEHLLRLRLDDVDGVRAHEDRVEDGNATGGAGEGRSLFCRPLRQNRRGPWSLRRPDKPHPLTSLREENRGPLGGRVRMSSLADPSHRGVPTRHKPSRSIGPTHSRPRRAPLRSSREPKRSLRQNGK
jgi:hypothetical protein